MDMPIPSVASWEWLNWKFPRPVYAGDTIYARWTLTQKRPPVGNVSTAIVVWRVDVHTADGALCAEGEVGASVTRKAVATAPSSPGQEPASAGVAASRRRRRRRTTPAAGSQPATDGAAPAIEPVADAAPAKKAAPERTSGGARRRRRRRPAGSSPARDGDKPAGGDVPEAPSAREMERALPSEAPAPQRLVPTTAAAAEAANPLRRVIRRLRRP